MSWFTRLFERRPEGVVAELPPFGTMRLDEKISAWVGEAEWLGTPVMLMIELDFDTTDPEPALPAARRLFEEAPRWNAVVQQAVLRDLPGEIERWQRAGEPGWMNGAVPQWLRLVAISASRDFHQFEFDAGGRLADHSVVLTVDWANDRVYAEVQG